MLKAALKGATRGSERKGDPKSPPRSSSIIQLLSSNLQSRVCTQAAELSTPNTEQENFQVFLGSVNFRFTRVDRVSLNPSFEFNASTEMSVRECIRGVRKVLDGSMTFFLSFSSPFFFFSFFEVIPTMLLTSVKLTNNK